MTASNDHLDWDADLSDAEERGWVDPEPMIDPFSGRRFPVADETLGYVYRPRTREQVSNREVGGQK